MGCFGGTTEKTQTSSLPDYLESAARSNVANAVDFGNKPFTPYEGEKTAPLTNDQNSAFDMIRSIAGTNNPYLSDVESLYKTFSNTPASSVSAPSILGGGTDVNSSTIQDYMSPYIMAALQPQLEDLTRQGVSQRKALDAQATMDGAYGDARSGVERSLQQQNEDILRNSIIGSGYNTAFNTAAGLRGQDITNSINTQNTNASLLEQALQRAITGGNALTNLNDNTIASASKLADAGATQQQAQQAKDSADLTEFLRGQGWDQNQIATVTAALAGTPYTKTTTSEEPNNSGWGIVGSLIGGLGSLFSDRRLKTDISVIGQTFDGLDIYRFKYRGDPRWYIGFIAQEIEQIIPDAVSTADNGFLMVDYGKVTQKASDMGASE